MQRLCRIGIGVFVFCGGYGGSFCYCVLFSHAHKHTVMDVKWNRNGNWMLTASRDHLIKLFDVRNMKDEVISFRGHKKEATSEYKY